MAADSRVNTSSALPPSYPKVRWARGRRGGGGGGGGGGGRDRRRHVGPGGRAEALTEGELTGGATESHQINDEKFSAGESGRGR